MSSALASKFAGLALDVEKAARMVILHPVSRQPLLDKQGKEAFIDILSGDSDAGRKYDRAVYRRRIARGTRAKLTPEELEGDAAGLLAALTSGWYLVDLDGNPIDVPCDAANAKELYQEGAMAWLRAQVDEFAADRANFAKASSAS